MDSWQARFDSFSKGKRVKKGSSTTILKWPHPSTFIATPDSLAEAGFYFTPGLGTPDAVRCFTCKKELSDWEAEDDPFSEHMRRGSSCCWAIVRCGLMQDMDDDGNFAFPNPSRYPSSKGMEKARLESYGSSWPHDRVKGHTANSKKMAQAGFVFSPQGTEDDTATCFYCGTSLSGWEDGDDPLEEHHKREAKSGQSCPFFSKPTVAQSQRSKPRPPSRSQSSRPVFKTKVKNAERAESTSSSSEEDLEAPDDLSETKRGIPSRTFAVPTRTPASRKSTRSTSTKASASKGTGASETEDDVEASESEVGKRVSKGRKKGIVKAKGRVAVIPEEDEDEVALHEQQVAPSTPPKPRRGRPPKNKTTSVTTKHNEKTADTRQDRDEVAVPTTRNSTHSKTRSKVNIEPELDASTASSLGTKGKASTRGKSKAMPATEIDSVPSPPHSGSLHGDVRTYQSTESEVAERVDRPSFDTTRPSGMKTQPKPRYVTRGPEVDDTQTSPLLDDQIKPKNRKCSSTSDDAGYATAEHGMNIDIEFREHLTQSSHNSTRSKSITQEDALQQSDSIDNVPGTSSRQGSIKPSRASSRPASTVVRSSSRLNNEVVDVSSSDDERKPATAPSDSVNASATKHTSALPHQPNAQASVNGTRQHHESDGPPGSLKKRSKVKARPSKFVVAVIAPPPSSNQSMKSKLSEDVEMADTDVVSSIGVEVSASPRLVSNEPPGEPPSSTIPPRTPSSMNIKLSESAVESTTLTLPSFDDEMEKESRQPMLPEINSSTSFTPFLSMIPLQKLTSLTEEECNMTLEQFIRREIGKQYMQFKEDATQRIALFQAKAAETRQMIESA